MKKKYSVKTPFYFDVDFIIDMEKYTKEMALATLDFFVWDYDKDNDPIDEVLKKIAKQCIYVATSENYNTTGVITEFDNMEGYPKLDGTFGITLTYCDRIEIDEDEFEIESEIIK